jgi:hypothetical protein
MVCGNGFTSSSSRLRWKISAARFKEAVQVVHACEFLPHQVLLQECVHHFRRMRTLGAEVVNDLGF